MANCLILFKLLRAIDVSQGGSPQSVYALYLKKRIQSSHYWLKVPMGTASDLHRMKRASPNRATGCLGAAQHLIGLPTTPLLTTSAWYNLLTQ